MMKKVFTVLFALLLCILPLLPASAADLPRLVDEADLLSDSEGAKLLEKLDEISEKRQVDIVVVTVDSLGGSTPREYADDFFDYNGYGFGADADGILLLVSMAERDWYISTCGYGIRAVTDAGLDYISDRFLPYLSDGDYAKAFDVFAGLCDDFIRQAMAGKPYDVGNMPRVLFSLKRLLIALGAGFILSLIVAEIMKAGLKSVSRQTSADGYVKRGSMQLIRSSDLFLYKNVSRRERPKESSSSSGRSGGSSTHHSSSGRSHGGGGGKF